MDVRVEGAYTNFEEPSDFNDYYNNPNIENHGNCKSYIRNDSIAIARNSRGGVIVGYDNIQTNTLTSLGSYDLARENKNFSIYNEENEGIESNFQIPDEMINNTRHPHNEMVKERLIIDKEGNVVKSKLSYAIWIEEDPEEERNETGWKEKREKDLQWIMTKKLAEQLGVPIVIIDREYFAKRETDILEMMVKILKGEKLDEYDNYRLKCKNLSILEFEKNKNQDENLSEIEYNRCKEKYESLSKPELIKEIIIKFENNRTGLQFNDKLNTKYFTQDKLEELLIGMINLIYQLDTKEKLECIQVYRNIVVNEFENLKGEDSEVNSERRQFYYKQVKKVNEIIDSLVKEEEYMDNVRKSIKIEKTIDSEWLNKRVKNKASIYNDYDLNTQISLNEIIGSAGDIVEDLKRVEQVQSKNHSTSKVHGVQHVKNVVLLSNYLGKKNGLSESDLKILREAAIYHDICHRWAGHREHAKEGAEWYLENEQTDLNKEEVAFLIESHEIKYPEQIQEFANEKFKYSTEERKKQLVEIAMILQDADRLDILRYDIDNPKLQRFNPDRLNNRENRRLIPAVIELNTRQAIQTGFIKPEVAENLNDLKTEYECKSIDVDKSTTKLSKLENTEGKTESRERRKKSHLFGMFSKLYIDNGTDKEKIDNVSIKLGKDLESNEKENSKNPKHDIKGE